VQLAIKLLALAQLVLQDFMDLQPVLLVLQMVLLLQFVIQSLEIINLVHQDSGVLNANHLALQIVLLAIKQLELVQLVRLDFMDPQPVLLALQTALV